MGVSSVRDRRALRRTVHVKSAPPRLLFTANFILIGSASVCRGTKSCAWLQASSCVTERAEWEAPLSKFTITATLSASVSFRMSYAFGGSSTSFAVEVAGDKALRLLLLSRAS